MDCREAVCSLVDAKLKFKLPTDDEIASHKAFDAVVARDSARRTARAKAEKDKAKVK